MALAGCGLDDEDDDHLTKAREYAGGISMEGRTMAYCKLSA